ncbi:hypothetical protein SARC_17683, partial [Sphaeroforma arctica JP610]
MSMNASRINYLRNHGTSPHTDTMTYEDMALDIEKYLKDNGISQADIIGHSL